MRAGLRIRLITTLCIVLALANSNAWAGSNPDVQLALDIGGCSFAYLDETSHYHVRLRASPAGGGFAGAGTGGDDPPMRVSVEVTTTYDDQTGLYTYSYSVTNDPQSPAAVEAFGVTPVLIEPDLGAPQHWRGRYGFDADATAAVWTTWDLGEPPPGWVWDGEDPYPSEFAIAPGQTLDGFTLTSPIPPGTLTYAATYWPDTPSIDDEFVNEPPFWSHGATGSVQGPGISGSGESETRGDGGTRRQRP